MLKRFKQTALEVLKTGGVFQLMGDSRWRQKRLLILGYHGISIADEHKWDYRLYMSPETFRQRLELVKTSGCTVLPLAEALERMYKNDLPEKSIAITFDDGTADFYQHAFPLLSEFNFPVTLYLTTFYSQFNRPVFDVACSYMLWKGRQELLDLKPITGEDRKVDLHSEDSRTEVLNKIQTYVNQNSLSAEEKDLVIARLAKQMKIDYDEFLAKRVLHLLNPEEVKALSAQGVDVQLHTHRHRMPRDRKLFLREIDDNRKIIRDLTGTQPSHFCYPSGVYDTIFLPWLKEAGIKSATTCDLGLATADENYLALPRLLDVSSLSPIEFTGWLAGLAVALKTGVKTAKITN